MHYLNMALSHLTWQHQYQLTMNMQHIQGAAEKSSPQKFLAVFSATV